MELPSIKAIDKVSVARICSGQVITDLATAVKELVENSLDAGAKHVEVKLKEFGLDLIEVSDNGSGVSHSNYESLALKYHTSKLTSFSDLSGVTSFGFRGEALSSLCELAGSFSVTTRTASESVGVKLTYGRNGKLLSKVGTTVSISSIFEPLPVRRGEFRRNIKKQYNRLLRGMQAYALISLGVRITVTNTKTKGGKQTLIGTQYNNKLDDNVINVFGAKFLSTMSPVAIRLDERDNEADAGEDAGEDATEKTADVSKQSSEQDSSKRRVWGMVSKAGAGVGRADNDRQFFYLNGRPVDLPKFTRAVSEAWRAYEMKQKPAFILDLRLPPGSFDVNVTPDKREIFMTGESEVLDNLKKALHELWAPSRYTIPVNQGQLVQARLTDGSFTRRDISAKSPPVSSAGKDTPHVGIVSPSPPEGALNARANTTPVEGDTDFSAPSDIGNGRAKGGNSLGSEDDIRATPREGQMTTARAMAQMPSSNSSAATAVNSMADKSTQPSSLLSSSKRRRSLPSGHQVGEEDGEDRRVEKARRSESNNAEVRDSNRHSIHGARSGSPENAERSEDKTVQRSPGRSSASSPGQRNVEHASGGSGNGGRCAPVAPLAFDVQSILRGCRRASRSKSKRDARNASAYSFSAQLSGSASANDQDCNAAARAFSRVLHKEHFTQMRVVGQFNLGFMICLLGADLFILDQHACDEKYNFEVLQKTTTIHQQPLVRPLPLETSASEEMTIIENMKLFEKNGFQFTVDDDQPTTRKLRITAVPFSKGTQFGVDDVHELASIVADQSSPGEMVRLPKARAMFASRACRSSIMIGKALDKGQMARVVAKMATIEQPWNCPHGRPTMRHLADVSKSLRATAGLNALLDM